MSVDLNSRREAICTAAQKVFEVIINLPRNIRSDEKERTGIQVLVREPGTRNMVLVAIGEPSEASKIFAVEKAVRSDVLDDMTSQNSENPNKMKFAGSVTVEVLQPDSFFLQASVSGLKAEEDVVVAISVLSAITPYDPDKIVEKVLKSCGKLPSCIFDKNHYLYSFVN